jgi:Uma2 family endonuclease
VAANDDVRPANPSVKFTYEDFLHFPDDGKRHEIIDGEHYVTPSPNTRHQVIVGKLSLAVGKFLEAQRRGELYERFAVQEYWVVDPELETIKIYRRATDGAFTRAAELSLEQGDVLATPLLPGFSVSLADVFAPPFP